MTEPYGMLLAMMQPSASMEEEFHDWYDTEHIPERAAIDGFLTAQRFVCLDGFPRYVAVYDLTHLGVLKEPGYVALSGDKFSPWSKRVLQRVHGQFRAEGVQIHPGHVIFGAKGTPGRVMLLRLRGPAANDSGAVVEGLKAVCTARNDVFQLRVWRSNYDADLCYIAMIEAEVSLSKDNLDLAPMGAMRRHIDLINVYVPYWRRGALHGVFPH